MSVVSVDDFLAHHGIKGMHWGVIRERQGGDGRVRGASEQTHKTFLKSLNGEERAVLKAVGANEHTDARLKAMYGPESAPKPQRKGLTSTQKKVLIGAGVGALAVGATAAAIYLNKSGKLPIGKILKPDNQAFKTFLKEHNETSIDRASKGYTKEFVSGLSKEPVTFKAGHIAKRVSTQAEAMIKDGGFFAAHEENDITRYKAVLPVYWKKWGLKAKEGYVVSLQSKVDIKAPSPKTTFDMFKELLNEDMDDDFFGKGKMKDLYYAGHSFTNDDDLARAAFPGFAQTWARDTHPVTAAFFEKVKKAGYNALVDMNDAGNLGDKPMRYLVGEEGFDIIGTEKLTKEGIKAARASVLSVVHAFLSNFLTFASRPERDATRS